MKILVTLLCIFIQINTNHAQDTLKVEEVKKGFSKGYQNGFSAKIPNAKLKEVVSDWKKYIHQKNKVSIKEIDGEYFLAKTIIPELSTDSLMIYSLFIPNPTNVEIISFVSSDDINFYSFSSNSTLSLSISEFIRNFAANEYRNVVTDEVSDEQKKLKKLEEDLQGLENENVRFEKKIKSNERANDRTKDEIKSNLQLQDLKSESILQQQKILATYLTQSEQKSNEEKKLKSLQKEKKKLESTNESLHKDIDDNESGNKELQKKIDKNNSDIIPAKEEEIKKQKEVISNLEQKLRGIR